MQGVSGVVQGIDNSAYKLIQKMGGTDLSGTLAKYADELANPANRDIIMHSLEDGVMKNTGGSLVVDFYNNLPKQYRSLLEAPELDPAHAGYNTQAFLKSIYGDGGVNEAAVKDWMARDPSTFVSNILRLADGKTQKTFINDLAKDVMERSAGNRIDYDAMRQQLAGAKSPTEMQNAKAWAALNDEPIATLDPKTMTPKQVFDAWRKEFGSTQALPQIANSAEPILPAFNTAGSVAKWGYDLYGNKAAGIAGEPLFTMLTGVPGGLSTLNATANLTGKGLGVVGDTANALTDSAATANALARGADTVGDFVSTLKNGFKTIEAPVPKTSSYDLSSSGLSSTTRPGSELGNLLRTSGAEALDGIKINGWKSALGPTSYQQGTVANTDLASMFDSYSKSLKKQSNYQDDHAQTVKFGVNDLLNNPQSALLKLQALHPELAEQLHRAMQQGEGVYKAMLFSLSQNPQTRTIFGAN